MSFKEQFERLKKEVYLRRDRLPFKHHGEIESWDHREDAWEKGYLTALEDVEELLAPVEQQLGLVFSAARAMRAASELVEGAEEDSRG